MWSWGSLWMLPVAGSSLVSRHMAERKLKLQEMKLLACNFSLKFYTQGQQITHSSFFQLLLVSSFLHLNVVLSRSFPSSEFKLSTGLESSTTWESNCELLFLNTCLEAYIMTELTHRGQKPCLMGWTRICGLLHDSCATFREPVLASVDVDHKN